MSDRIKILVLIAGIFIAGTVRAQVPSVLDTNPLLVIDSAAKLRVGTITISGNKRTKSYIIEREIHLKTGDTIFAGDLQKHLERATHQVYNTTLFTEVNIIPDVVNSPVLNLHVQVKEKWYLYPSPQFQLVDRNFNEWVKVYHADLNRVIYGAKFAHYNFSGRRDQLRIYLLNGYARNFSFSYRAPYSNRSLTEGFAVSAGFTQNREIPFKTNYYNKLLQYNNGAFVRNALNASLSYISRKGYFQSHAFSLAYTHNEISDTIIQPAFNPNYFQGTNSTADYVDFRYAYSYANTNNIKYPLTGITYGLNAVKRGFGLKGGINLFMIDLDGGKYFSHGKGWYSNVNGHIKMKAPFTLAYINQHALGYEEFYLRGLEYYVIDAIAATTAKYTLRKHVGSFKVPLPFHIKAIPFIPFNFYAKAYGDLGYAYAKPPYVSRLNNELLYSSGIGLDILTLYDMNIGLEYTFNQLGEKGLFLHVKGGF